MTALKRKRAASTDTIPEGPASRLGKGVAGVLLGAAALAAILDGDHTEETIAALLSGVAIVHKYMDGRYKQATAKLAKVDVTVEDAR
jgi:hypothetical protein